MRVVFQVSPPEQVPSEGLTPAPGAPRSERHRAMLDLQVSIHVFMSVLILGTIFRLVSYHLMASSNPGIQHIGKAMSTQY